MKKKESDFRRHVLNELRGNNCLAIAIETKTHVGVPDIFYVTKNGVQGWIELKVINANFDEKETYARIPFRPGQQRFALEYRAFVGVPIKCFVLYNNGTYEVDMNQFYVNNEVPVRKCMTRVDKICI